MSGSGKDKLQKPLYLRAVRRRRISGGGGRPFSHRDYLNPLAIRQRAIDPSTNQ
jgi:hypothetical protein